MTMHKKCHKSRPTKLVPGSQINSVFGSYLNPYNSYCVFYTLQLRLTLAAPTPFCQPIERNPTLSSTPSSLNNQPSPLPNQPIIEVPIFAQQEKI